MSRTIDGDMLVDMLKQIVSDYTSHGMYPSAFPIEYAIDIVEKMPTITPPNEPLTLDELREMEAPTPVWWGRMNIWCLCERGFITTPNGNIYAVEETGGAFYRRPQEGEEANNE